MKNTPLFLIIAFASILFACSGNSGKEQSESNISAVDTTNMYFGDTITVDGAIAADQLLSKFDGKDSIKIKVSAVIDEVCQKKGCWMTLNIGNDQYMRVSFKDYEFFMPKDAAGKKVFIDGYAYKDTISVAELKHYAEDAQKSKEEIEKITQPEISISFEANGVIIKK